MLAAFPVADMLWLTLIEIGTCSGSRPRFFTPSRAAHAYWHFAALTPNLFSVLLLSSRGQGITLIPTTLSGVAGASLWTLLLAPLYWVIHMSVPASRCA